MAHQRTKGPNGKAKRATTRRHPALLPSPAALAAPAKVTDWPRAREDSIKVTPYEMRGVERKLTKNRDVFERVRMLEVRSNKALAVALGYALATATVVMSAPHVLLALCDARGIRLTQATLQSPCLPFMKAACPTLDAKQQSHFATVLNLGLVGGLRQKEFEELIATHGTVKLAKLERQGRALRDGKAHKTASAEDLFARFRQGHPPLPLDQIAMKNPNSLALAVVGIVDGKLAVLALDDDQARLVPVLRRFVSSGLRARVDAAPPQVIEPKPARRAKAKTAKPASRARS